MMQLRVEICWKWLWKGAARILFQVWKLFLVAKGYGMVKFLIAGLFSINNKHNQNTMETYRQRTIQHD